MANGPLCSTPLLRDAGFRIRYVNFGRDPDVVPDLDRYHGLIVLGGPMNCDQVARHRHLATEVTAIQHAVRDGLLAGDGRVSRERLDVGGKGDAGPVDQLEE